MSSQRVEGRFSGIYLLNVSSVGRLMSLYIVPLVVTRGATQCPSMSLDIKVSPGLCTRVFDWAAKRARIERGVLVAVAHCRRTL